MEQENIIIRPATMADMDTLLRFEQGVITTERPFDPTIKPDPVNYYDLPKLITAPHIYMAVAELNGELIGCGYARIETSELFLNHAQHAYLGFMYVVPQHRGKGVNKLVIDSLAGWAGSRGINELQLQVFYGNSPAIKAYEKIGFIKNMIKMRKGL